MTSTIELLLEQVDDPQLRAKLIDQFDGIRKRTEYGRLNFEEQADEAVRIPSAKVTRRTTVQPVAEPGPRVYDVRRIVDGIATITRPGVEPRDIPVTDLVVAHQLGAPVYTGLTPLGELHQGGDKPAHLVIQGENYHALQTLLYTHENKVDLIYIDPPYNTGAGDWIYNDRYVGDKDAYRHSKWLAFMDKRLRLARRLLKDTGVIIVAIDDNEHHRLRILLDDVFGERNFISNVVWHGGRKNDSRYVSNGADYMLVYAKSADALSAQGTRWREAKTGIEAVLAAGQEAWLGALEEAYRERDDYLTTRRDEESFRTGKYVPATGDYWSFVSNAIRERCEREGRPYYGVVQNYGKAASEPENIEGFLAQLAKNAPEEEYAIRARAGEIATARMKTWWKSLPKDHPAQASKHYSRIDGWSGRVYFPDNISSASGANRKFDVTHPLTGLAVPVPARGWAGSAETMERWSSENRVHFGSDHSSGINAKKYLEDVHSQVPDVVFYKDRRSSAMHLRNLLAAKDFPFPKDVDVIARWVGIASASNPDAVVLDFFGGTGTTAEAVMRLNEQDGGRRQAILVTNNELGQKQAKDLAKAGFGPGDAEWESQGVFEKVTRPRLETVVTAVRRDGSALTDAVFDDRGTKVASGIAGAKPLAENIVFAKLDYLDRTNVERGAAFHEVALLLYAEAGATGPVISERPETFEVTETYGVLTDVTYRREFVAAIEASGARHAYIVEDDITQYQGVSKLFGDAVTTHHLYEDYLVNFAINTGEIA